MWALDNSTPYGAERNWVRDKQGRHFWVVAVKATFDVSRDGQLVLAAEQPPPSLEPVYLGKPGASSLRWDSDLLYIKPCTDVIAEASAHAPRHQARETVPVSLRVGNLHKQLVVHGDRVYYQAVSGLTTTNPSPFISRPITYESAFGGFERSDPDASRHRLDDRNPIGRGAFNASYWENELAHSVEYISGDVESMGPAGFGPIDPSWMPRRGYAGTYDEKWFRSKKPLLPDDYNELFGSSAPVDQRVLPHLRGGEPVELQNLTPQGWLRFTLPKIALTYTTHFGARREEHRGRLATVLIRPEFMQLSLTWQTTLYVAPQDGDYLDKTQIGEKRYL